MIPTTLEERRQAALKWLGDRHLLARPINKPIRSNRKIANEKLESSLA